MRLIHRVPCNECPWRKNSLQGWLGGHDAEFYTDVPLNNEVPACHLRDHGPDSDDTAFCVGALGVINNACILPYNGAPGSVAAAKRIGKLDFCFEHPRAFFQYHTFNDREYVPYLVRALSVDPSQPSL